MLGGDRGVVSFVTENSCFRQRRGGSEGSRGVCVRHLRGRQGKRLGRKDRMIFDDLKSYITGFDSTRFFLIHSTMLKMYDSFFKRINKSSWNIQILHKAMKSLDLSSICVLLPHLPPSFQLIQFCYSTSYPNLLLLPSTLFTSIIIPTHIRYNLLPCPSPTSATASANSIQPLPPLRLPLPPPLLPIPDPAPAPPPAPRIPCSTAPPQKPTSLAT